MKLFLSFIIVISTGLSFAQTPASSHTRSEDNAASRLIKKKKEKTRRTESTKKVQEIEKVKSSDE